MHRNVAGGLMLNKVPEVTLIFWAIKIMSTTVGETGADYLAVHVGLGTAATDLLMTTLLMLALSLQLRARRYVPWIYVDGRASQYRWQTNYRCIDRQA